MANRLGSTWRRRENASRLSQPRFAFESSSSGRGFQRRQTTRFAASLTSDAKVWCPGAVVRRRRSVGDRKDAKRGPGGRFLKYSSNTSSPKTDRHWSDTRKPLPRDAVLTRSSAGVRRDGAPQHRRGKVSLRSRGLERPPSEPFRASSTPTVACEVTPQAPDEPSFGSSTAISRKSFLLAGNHRL